MRINETPPSIVTRPATTSSVIGVSAGAAVGGQGNPAAQAVLVREQTPAPAPVPPVEAERRAYVRRSEERRKLQVRVLMDTRVGQRRTARRRAADETPASIDVEA
jgi:hypothetical protein